MMIGGAILLLQVSTEENYTVLLKLGSCTMVFPPYLTVHGSCTTVLFVTCFVLLLFDIGIIRQQTMQC